MTKRMASGKVWASRTLKAFPRLALCDKNNRNKNVTISLMLLVTFFIFIVYITTSLIYRLNYFALDLFEKFFNISYDIGDSKCV